MTNIRIRREDREILSKLKESEEIQQMAIDKGIIESKDERFSYEQLFELIIPDDADVIERPEDDMAWITGGEMKDEIQRLAGENVSAHRVVREFMHEFIEKHEIEVTNNE